MSKSGFYRSEFKNHTLKEPLSPEAAAAYRSGTTSEKSRSPLRNIAYRTGSALFDQRERTGHDYSNRAKRIVERSAIFAPPSAPDWVYDRERLWNEVIASEKRKDARWMKEDILSLDYGLNREQRWQAVCSFVQDASSGRVSSPTCPCIGTARW